MGKIIEFVIILVLLVVFVKVIKAELKLKNKKEHVK